MQTAGGGFFIAVIGLVYLAGLAGIVASIVIAWCRWSGSRARPNASPAP